MKSEKKGAIYKDLCRLELEGGMEVEWSQLDLPFGSKVDMIARYEEVEYSHGRNGIVWATHDFEQAETIKGVLGAQGINSRIVEQKAYVKRLYLLKIQEPSLIESAIDFIWRSDEGLKLKPDWHYPAGEANRSFDDWMKAK